MSSVKTQNSSGQKDASSRAALERSVKNMKMIIAALSVGLVASIIYIVASPSQSTQPENAINYGYPAASQEVEQTPAPPPTQMETEMMSDAPAGAMQSPPPATAAPAANPTANAPAPAGQQSGKINPPHGQPGHSCAVPVGSPLN